MQFYYSVLLKNMLHMQKAEIKVRLKVDATTKITQIFFLDY